VDLAELDDRTERINITLPRKVSRVVDEAAKRSGGSRSSYLAWTGLGRRG
jgi:metal-responsive CopG/Arc/MetJ family transcriptional regulator